MATRRSHLQAADRVSEGGNLNLQELALECFTVVTVWAQNEHLHPLAVIKGLTHAYAQA